MNDTISTEASEAGPGKRSRVSNLTVVICFAVAAVLLISSLVSPGKAHTRLKANPAGSPSAAMPL